MKLKFYLLFLLAFVCAATAEAAKLRPISEVQGEKQISPLEGKEATVQGVVTARVRNGFYIQTPDGQDDKNSKTSEAIFIFTGKEPPKEATVGNLVEVTGTVSEFRPKSEPATLPITQISLPRNAVEVNIISKDNALPKPFVLTAVDFEAKTLSEAVEALERYESMRIKVTSLTVVAPTDGRKDEKTATAVSNGDFSGVLTGTPRPFREQGIEFFETGKFAKELPPQTQVFDGNNELLRVDSDGQLGASAIDVTVSATIKNLVGVLGYEYRTWTILPDPTNSPVISGNIMPTAVITRKYGEFTIGSTNVERFFDDTDEPSTDEPILTKEAFQNRLKKASLVIRDYLKTPDILGVIEIENLATLQRLADRINEDMSAAGKKDFKYEAFLAEGNDIGGIDSGFLVNTARVTVIKTEQIGKDETFKRPSNGKTNPLNDRPSFVLSAAVKNGDKAMNVTVVVNHLKSLRGYFDADGDTRTKKKLQAEALARWIQKFQTEKPNEPLILVGDFNAFQFNDGIVDVIGTLKGKPAPKEMVLMPSDDLVNPDLTNLIDMIPRDQRYSFTFAGNAQTLDHFLVNEAAKKHAARFGFARVNADFPEIYRNDPNRPERFSDHDAAVGYFTFDETKPAVKP